MALLRSIVAAVTATALLVAPGALAEADELMRDFRNRDFDNATFQMAGPQAEECLEPTADGLRVKLLDGKSHDPTGISLRFPVRGDFEIVLTYEIRQLTPPTTGYGVGVGLYIETDSPTKEALTLERFVVPGDGEVFASTRGTMENGNRVYQGKRFPAQGSRQGKLRLTRRGTSVTASVTDGTNTTPHTLQTVEMPAGDLTYVRIAGDTGGAPSKLDAVFKDLRITADLLVNAPKPPRSFLARNWPAVAGVLLLVIVVVIVVIIVRNRSRSD